MHSEHQIVVCLAFFLLHVRIGVQVTTLEVWSHNFTERYNIFLSAKNSVNKVRSGSPSPTPVASFALCYSREHIPQARLRENA